MPKCKKILTLATFLFFFRISNHSWGESGFKLLNSTLRFYVPLDAGSPSGFQRSSQQFRQKKWLSVVNFIIQYPIFVVVQVEDYLVFIYDDLKFISLSIQSTRNLT